MSSLAYGAVTRKRLEADANTSNTTKPPGVKTYVDTVAALVPAEVLALHAFIATIATSTSTVAGVATTTITDRDTLRATFWVCIGLSIALYAFGRIPTTGKQWNPADCVRILIPPAAFVLWTILQKSTAWDALAGASLSNGERVLIGATGAILLGAIAALLGMKANGDTP